jgi:hypothetical protein
MPQRVWVSDQESPLGRRVVDRLVEAGAEPVGTPYDGCDVAVITTAADTDRLSASGRSLMIDLASRLGSVSSVPEIGQLVLVSSAMVYGAWENNPVPLTEDAVVRPDPSFVYARHLAATEVIADRWRSESSHRRLCVLRPVIPMASTGTSGLAAALAAAYGQRLAQDDPPAQFVHLDDLASAVTLAVQRSLDGVFNVAPDGSVPASRVRALSGASPRVRLPDRWGDAVASLRWRFQRGPIPPGLHRYARTTWLVSNDRLRQEGWRPTVTNEQAYVEGTEAKWWTMVSPKRRQEVALGSVVVLALMAAWWSWWASRRSRWWRGR